MKHFIEKSKKIVYFTIRESFKYFLTLVSITNFTEIVQHPGYPNIHLPFSSNKYFVVREIRSFGIILDAIQKKSQKTFF